MPDFASLSKNKIIFFALTGVIVLSIVIGISMLGSKPAKNTASKAPKELTVWVVGDETAGFSDIITGFKNRYPNYKNTDVKITKFGNYVDYEKTLLTVLADGNSPDIFVVSSSDGGLLESKILAIPADIIKPDEFSKNFNRVFDDLVIENKDTNTSGKEKTTAGIKGVPLGYQAMGVFYNWKLVKTIPRSWNDIGQNNASLNDTTPEGDTSSSSDTPDYTDILL